MMTTASAELLKRTVPPLAAYLTARLVETPRVKHTLRRVDAKLLGAAVRHRNRFLAPRRLLRVATGVVFLLFGTMLVVRAARTAEV